MSEIPEYYNVYKNGKYQKAISADKIDQYKGDGITIVSTEKDGWKMDSWTAVDRTAELAIMWYNSPDRFFPTAKDRKQTCFDEAYKMIQEQHPEVDLSPFELHTSIGIYLKPIEEQEAITSELEKINKEYEMGKALANKIEGLTKDQVIEYETKRQILDKIKNIRHNLELIEENTSDFKYVMMVSKWINKDVELINQFADTAIQWRD